MNQRIRELADQVTEDMAYLLAEDMFGPWNIPDEFCKKFAELIVRECCDIFVELRTRPADLAVKDVKKHFGVEE